MCSFWHTEVIPWTVRNLRKRWPKGLICDGLLTRSSPSKSSSSYDSDTVCSCHRGRYKTRSLLSRTKAPRTRARDKWCTKNNHNQKNSGLESSFRLRKIDVFTIVALINLVTVWKVMQDSATSNNLSSVESVRQFVLYSKVLPTESWRNDLEFWTRRTATEQWISASRPAPSFRPSYGNEWRALLNKPYLTSVSLLHERLGTFHFFRLK